MNHDQMFLKSSPYFMISNDEYHLKEIERLNLMKQYLENIKQYQESEYFYGLKNIKEKIFCEGYAENLDKDLTIPLKPVKNIMTYIDSKKKLNIRKGLCNIGPFVTVNVNGNITECNASFEHQNTIYNYGNVLTDSIESVYLKQKIKIIKPKKWELETAKIMEKF
jgi:hypothetical protein